MAREYIEREDLLNQGRVKLNKSIDKSYDAEANSLDAKNIANQSTEISNEAKDIAANTDERLDNIVAGEMKDGEVIDARKPFGEEAYLTLSSRLNSIDNHIKSNFDKTKLRVTPFDFEAKGDGITDDYPAFVKMFDFANKYDCEINLMNGHTYLLKTKPTGVTPVFTLNNRMYIDGFSTIKIDDNFGDFFALFKLEKNFSGSILKNFSINENTSENNTTENNVGENTNRSTYRILFHGFGAEPIENLTIDNLTVNETLGVWQFFIYGKNINFINNTIDYAKTNGGLSVNYDRTTLYAVGKNWNIDGNFFQGNSYGRTCMETHGDGMVFANNRIVNYKWPGFTTNDTGDYKYNIKSIKIIHNRVECVGGFRVWLDTTNDIEHLLFFDNDITCTGDYPAIMLEETYGAASDGVLGLLEIYKNRIYCNNTTRQAISLQSIKTKIREEKPYTIRNININENIIEGTYREVFRLQVSSRYYIKFGDVHINNNMLNIESMFNLITVSDGLLIGFGKTYFSNNHVTVQNSINGNLVLAALATGVDREKKLLNMSNNVYVNNTGKKISVGLYQSNHLLNITEMFDEPMSNLVLELDNGESTYYNGIITSSTGVRKIMVYGSEWKNK